MNHSMRKKKKKNKKKKILYHLPYYLFILSSRTLQLLTIPVLKFEQVQFTTRYDV